MGRGIVNTHTRTISAPADVLGEHLDRLGGPRDRLWPSPAWWPLRLAGRDGERLAVGASGGHGPIRYAVDEYEPGRRVRFRFAPVTGLDGYHEFTVVPETEPGGAPRCRVTHVLRARPSSPRTRVLWSLVIRPLHDALLEDLLDRAELLATGRVSRPARWSPPVRALHALRWPRPRAVPVPPRAAPADAGPGDLADAYRVELRAGMPADPATWADALTHHSPMWVRAAMALREALVGLVGIERGGSPPLRPIPGGADDEALLGADASHLDVRVSILVHDGAVIASTVARTHNRRGRLYLRAIRPIHSLVVRSLLRRSSRRLALAATRATR